MPRDLSIYSFHPHRRHLTITLIVIAALAVFGFVRGLMSASNLALVRDASGAGRSASVGQPAVPVDLPPVTSLTPKVILPPPPPRPAVPEQAKSDVPEEVIADATNAPAAEVAIDPSVTEAPAGIAAPAIPAITPPPAATEAPAATTP